MKAYLKQMFQPVFTADFARDVLQLLFGCFVVAVGLSYFISPYKIVPGGIFGLSIILRNFIPAYQIGTIALVLQIPLLICSALFLGSRLGLQTLIATFATPLMVNFVTSLAFTNPEALQALDPSQMFGGKLDMTNDLIVSCIIGAALVGIGTSFIIRAHASSGGTDIIAMLLHKFLHLHFSRTLIVVDGTIVLLGLFVIGFGWGLDTASTEGSWRLSFYSLITMVIMNRAMAWGISGNRDSKIIYIICEAGAKQKLREWILFSLDRTATHMQAKGLYSETDKEIIILVVREREVNIITDQIRNIAPRSFVIVSDSYDVYGFRWKDLPKNNGLDFK